MTTDLLVTLDAVDRVTPVIREIVSAFAILGLGAEEATHQIKAIMRAYSNYVFTSRDMRIALHPIHDYTGHRHRGTRAWARRYRHKGSPS